MLSDDGAAPVDRPNLSKDYLAGSAPEDWLPLRPDSFYAESGIELRLGASAQLDRHQGAQGHHRRRRVGYDRLLLATGAEPVRLPIPGRRPAACPHPALARPIAGAIIAPPTARAAPS